MKNILCLTISFYFFFFLVFLNDVKGQSIEESREIFQSDIISSSTPGHGDSVDVDITGVKRIYLVATNGGDGNGCDHADWIEPIIYNNDDTVKLTEIDWENATTGWGTIGIDQSISGNSLNVNNKTYNNGIGTHANSVIEYNLPSGYKRFKTFCGLDNGGVSQGCGSTVKFYVFALDSITPVDTTTPKFTEIPSGEILSPDQRIKMVLRTKTEPLLDSGEIWFNVLTKNNEEYEEIMPNSPMGISRLDEKFVGNLKLIEITDPIQIHDSYEMVSGKRNHCENFGTERIFKFLNTNNQPVNFEIRAYNNGIAFRYVFPDTSQDMKNIVKEATAYTLPSNTHRWMQPFTDAYEDFYPLNTTGSGTNPSQEWGYPALYKVNDKPYWVLISEANISKRNYGTRLSNKDDLNTYKVKSPPMFRSDIVLNGVKTTLPWQSAWRVLIIGSLSDIVESTLITDVSDTNKTGDPGWIEPGPVSWIYWAYNHGSKNYSIVKEYVDLAVEMGWPYVLIDWEWDVMSNGGNIEDAVDYANSNGIKPLIWYNSGTGVTWSTPYDRLLTAAKRKAEFEWLNSIGVYGIKVDFFAGDQQDMMQYYIEILEDAAKYNLLVNFHGATIPRGWQRTYPNLMSVEAVYGAEWYNNAPTLTNRAAGHNTTLPFTRNVIGSMDYTPVTFSNSQNPHITSYGHELALSVVFESGLQHFADRPSAYYNLPSVPKQFLQKVPVAWDDTKLIDGYPGEKAVIARRKDNIWYIGGLNGKTEEQTIDLDLSFLDEGSYFLVLIKDGNNNKSFEIDTMTVTKGDAISVPCLKRGGFSGVLSQRDTSVINTIKFNSKKISTINIYPNPASKIINVDVSNQIGQKVDLFDMNGKKLASYQLYNNKAVIDVSQLKPACYYISVLLNNNIERKKFIITR